MTKIRSFLTLLFLIGICSTFIVPDKAQGAKTPSEPGGLKSVRELISLSGMGKLQGMAQKETPPAVFADSSVLGTLDMQSEQIQLIDHLYSKSFDANEFYNARQKYFLDNFDAESARLALAWFRSPEGRRVVEAQREYSQTIGDFQSRMSEVASDLPSKRRLVIVERIADARMKSDFDSKVRVSVLRVVDPLSERLQAASTEAMINKVNNDLQNQIKTNNLLYVLYIYQKLKNEDLEKLAGFYESPAGKWFNRVHFGASLKGLDAVNVQVNSHLQAILAIIDSGKEDAAMIKEVFPPGLRFLIAKREPPILDPKELADSRRSGLAKKRDPFSPLVVAELKMPEKDLDIPILGPELDILKNIPLEVFQKIKEMDLMLYEDLEKNAALFREKKELEALPHERYMEIIDNYKSLIDKANDLVEEIITTPLQVDYDALKLTGFVWTGDLNLALVETSGNKGHSVRVGTLIGPRFGIVESVDSEKIVVVERERDYLGNIVTNTLGISFDNPEEK